MYAKDAEKMLKRDMYQVFLLSCPAAIPIIFATHTWFVVNKKGVVSRFEVLWGRNWDGKNTNFLYTDFYSFFQGIEMLFFSRSIFWKNVRLLGVIEGDEDSTAAQMAIFITSTKDSYPFRERYAFFGPNSNTYTQSILNRFPESKLKLPWSAFGKSYLPPA